MKLLKKKIKIKGKIYEQHYINIPNESVTELKTTGGIMMVYDSKTDTISFNPKCNDINPKNKTDLTLKESPKEDLTLKEKEFNPKEDLTLKKEIIQKICPSYLSDLEMCYHPKIGYKKRVQCGGNEEICDLRSGHG